MLFNRLLARITNAVIVKSAEMARTLAPTQVNVIPNGVNLDEFCPMPMAEARAALGWNPCKRYILFPGNPTAPVKGFDLAQQAVCRVREYAGDDIELAILWGVAPKDVPLYMNASDAMVLTSASEGSPNVVKEALACNLPVIAVAVGDVPQLLANIDGCRVCRRDAQEIAAVLLEQLGRGRAMNARASLQDKGLDLPSVAKRVLHLYETTIRDHASGEQRTVPTT